MQPFHPCFFEDIERSFVRRVQQQRGRTQLPAFRTFDRFESLLHFKTGCLIVAPPPGKTGNRSVLMITFMYKNSSDGARPWIEVFIIAPAGKINIPVVQMKGILPAACARSKPIYIPAFLQPQQWPSYRKPGQYNNSILPRKPMQAHPYLFLLLKWYLRFE